VTRIPAESSHRENADPIVPAPMIAICSAMHYSPKVHPVTKANGSASEFVIHMAHMRGYRQFFGVEA
jgi:hypothetical protein